MPQIMGEQQRRQYMTMHPCPPQKPEIWVALAVLSPVLMNSDMN